MLDDYYEVVAKDGEQFSLSWVDGPCFKEILSSMNLKNENLPKIIAYNPSKDTNDQYYNYLLKIKINIR